MRGREREGWMPERGNRDRDGREREKGLSRRLLRVPAGGLQKAKMHRHRIMRHFGLIVYLEAAPTDVGVG